VTIQIAQEGADTVRIVASGSLRLNGLTKTDRPGRPILGDYAFLEGFTAGTGGFDHPQAFVRKSGEGQDHYTGGVLESTFPIAGSDLQGSPSTLNVSIGIVSGERLMIGQGYTSGEAISFDVTLSGSLEESGFEVGQFLSYSWVTDGGEPESVTLRVVDAVPEPGAAAIVALFAGILGVAPRRRSDNRAAQ